LAGVEGLGINEHYYFGRLNVNGSRDASFQPAPTHFGGGDGRVSNIKILADGRVLVHGFFELLAGQPSTNFARLNASGVLDTTFKTLERPNFSPFAVQADGKILACAYFGSYGLAILRLLPNGGLDTTFQVFVFSLGGGNPSVGGLAVQADGKILVTGQFDTVGNQPAYSGDQPRTNIARFNHDGSLDSSFNVQVVGLLYDFALQADVKIIIRCIFNHLN
jgi:uncharacterized delta-60 repeat protein